MYSSRPTCQLCHKIGHTAPNCWQRLDHSSTQNSPQAAAFLVTAKDSPDYEWYHDTGYNHHVTNELANLNVRADAYDGPDQIKVGNDQGLRILHTGTATLPSSNHNFCLSSLLHVPQIGKNLISVNKFTRDNGVFVEFHPNSFFVKDLHPQKLLLQVPSRNGLYPWPPSHPSFNKPIANIGEKVPMDDWHG